MFNWFKKLFGKKETKNNFRKLKEEKFTYPNEIVPLSGNPTHDEVMQHVLSRAFSGEGLIIANRQDDGQVIIDVVKYEKDQSEEENVD